MGNPDSAKAVNTAEGPGAAVTRTPAAMAASTNRYPGSETAGIPASETIRRLAPARTEAINSAVRDASLCSW